MKNIGYAIIASLTLIIIAVIGGFVYLQAQNQQTVTVTGTASQNFIPDRLDALFNIVEVDMDQSVASAKVSERLISLKTALKGVGINESQLEQGTVSVSPYYDYSNNAPVTDPSKQKKQVSQTINLKIDQVVAGDLADLSKKITSAVTALNPGIENYNFSYDFVDRKKLGESLREKAVSDAQDKANKTLTTLGSKTGGVVSIVENTVNSNFPYPIAFDKSMMSPGSLEFSTSPTSQSIEFSVIVTFKIESKKLFGIL